MRFLREAELDENSVAVMPEMLLPVCNRAYREAASAGSGRDDGDTVMVMDEGDHGWHNRFKSFAEHGRHVSGVLSFSDYAIVVQAALLGQGIALGWLNVLTHWLRQGALVPAEDELIATARLCCLVWPTSRPLRPIVGQVRDWLIEEVRADLSAVDQTYPQLKLLDTLEAAGFAFGRESGGARKRRS
jgi:DNA-binding transcriptional LysR family regulator